MSSTTSILRRGSASSGDELVLMGLDDNLAKLEKA